MTGVEGTSEKEVREWIREEREFRLRRTLKTLTFIQNETEWA